MSTESSSPGAGRWEYSPELTEILQRKSAHAPLYTFRPIRCRSHCASGWPCADWEQANADFTAYTSRPRP